MVYRYYCLYEPPAPDTFPRGLVGMEETAEPTWFPQIEDTAWGFADYTRRLTEQEVLDYGLRGPEVQPEIRPSR